MTIAHSTLQRERNQIQTLPNSSNTDSDRDLHQSSLTTEQERSHLCDPSAFQPYSSSHFHLPLNLLINCFLFCIFTCSFSSGSLQSLLKCAQDSTTLKKTYLLLWVSFTELYWHDFSTPTSLTDVNNCAPFSLLTRNNSLKNHKQRSRCKPKGTSQPRLSQASI